MYDRNFLTCCTHNCGRKSFFYHTDPAGTPLAMTGSSGTVVWRADYKPFGEEQSVTQSPENVMKFVGKEKDKETGLHYFGARYMKDEIGRFITTDPVGPVDPRTSKTNYSLLTNLQKLNRYAYSLNNPYKYLDINGAWEEDVHSGIGNTNYGTYVWATHVGFNDRDARLIAKGNNSTDLGGWSGWIPIIGDQSRHFNQPYLFSSGIGDTRDYWANLEYQRAVEYMEEGNVRAALGHLGKGLHSLQDKFAHRDWDTGIIGTNRHPDWYDKWNDPRNKEAAENTTRASLNYLRSFMERFKQNGE
jgi:RHS repeat-associated protein